MGVLDWLFNGGDNRAASRSDLENRRSQAHNKWSIFFTATQAEQRRKNGDRKMTAKERNDAAKKANSWWGSNSGSHAPKKNGWWD